MAKGYSLHVGLDAVNPEMYEGKIGKLICCEADARAMEQLARAAGYTDRTLLLTAEATREHFVSHYFRVCDSLKEGDIFLITFSGHGSQVPDENGEEKDGQDEALCFFDNRMIDDDIYRLLCHVPEKVRVVLVSDACHSETIYKDGTIETENVYERMMQKIKNTDHAADIRVLSACRDWQEAEGGTAERGHGLFTHYVLEVYNEQRPHENYGSFMNEIKRRMKGRQMPAQSLLFLGERNSVFDGQRPFQI